MQARCSGGRLLPIPVDCWSDGLTSQCRSSVSLPSFCKRKVLGIAVAGHYNVAANVPCEGLPMYVKSGQPNMDGQVRRHSEVERQALTIMQTYMMEEE